MCIRDRCFSRSRIVLLLSSRPGLGRPISISGEPPPAFGWTLAAAKSFARGRCENGCGERAAAPAAVIGESGGGRRMARAAGRSLRTHPPALALLATLVAGLADLASLRAAAEPIATPLAASA